MRNVTLPVAVAALCGLLVVPFPVAAATTGASSTISTGAPDNDASYVPLHDHDLADSPTYVRDPLPGLLAGLFAERPRDRGPGSREDHEAAAKFYQARDHAPIWVGDGRFTPKARRAIFRLAKADADGLDASRYRTASLDIGVAGRAGAKELARAEFDLTLAVLAYAREAQAGLVEPTSMGKFVTAEPVRPDPVKVLGALSEVEDPATVLNGYNPQHPAFKALRGELARLRAAGPGVPRIEIGDGPSMKPGMRDARVPALRERLGVAAVGGAAATLYDERVKQAVSDFQGRGGLEADGVVGPQTRAALNGAADAGVEDVLVNMERWRWLPSDMDSEHYVWVNVPEFRLRVVTRGETAFETRVIVGTTQNQTPIFSDEIEYVDVNPYWNVPRSIATKEMLPEAQRDPSFFYRRGIEVLYTQGGRTMQVDPYSIDWRQWNASNMPFRFRQPPGDANALGRVKFMFPNEHAVYLHDTPTRNLFNRGVRAFSHGCVRVENPVEFSEALLSFEESLNGARIKKLIGGGRNGSLPMKRHVPVHLTYFTVWVDERGDLQRRPDIYGHDARLKAALGLDHSG